MFYYQLIRYNKRQWYKSKIDQKPSEYLQRKSESNQYHQIHTRNRRQMLAGFCWSCCHVNLPKWSNSIRANHYLRKIIFWTIITKFHLWKLRSDWSIMKQRNFTCVELIISFLQIKRISRLANL